jgi:hypothetical protein
MSETSTNATVSPGMHLGLVTDVHPATNSIDVTVDEGGGAQDLDNIPVMSSFLDPDLRGGGVALPKIGATAVIAAGVPETKPVCLGFVPTGHENFPEDSADLTPTEIMAKATSSFSDPKYGAEDPLYSMSGDESYREGGAGELSPGDWAMKGTDGNALAVLEGGTTVLKGSDLAQVIANKVGDLVRIVARNFELMTDFGQLSIKSEEGRAWLELDGASDVEEGHPDKENWSMRMAMGTEDNAFELTFGDKASIKISNSGDIQILGRSIQTLETSGTAVVEDSASSRRITYKGADRKDVEGTYARTAKVSTHTTGRYNLVVSSGDANIAAANGNLVTTVAKRRSEVVNGNAVHSDGIAKPGDVAKETEVVNGDYNVDIGNPASGALPLTQSAYNLKAHQGDVHVEAGATGIGTVTLASSGIPGVIVNPGDVVLGGVDTEAAEPVCKYDSLLRYVQALHKALDLHFHGTAVGPSSPPAPMSPMLEPLIRPVRSLTTKVSL